MSDELGVNSFPLNIPNSASSIDTGSPNTLRFSIIPVKGGKRATELAVLVAIKKTLELNRRRIIRDTPNAEKVAGSGEKIGALALLVGDEDGLSRRVRMFEGEIRVGADLAAGVIKLDNLDTIGILLEEASNGETVLLVTADAPVHGVDVPWGFIGVDLRALLLLVGSILIGIAACTHRNSMWKCILVSMNAR
uniref:Uncharacterized protein n=1 Tax=Cucumis sativus TaxID=3659 RepID=A0A0A0LAK5_CUCSA